MSWSKDFEQTLSRRASISPSRCWEWTGSRRTDGYAQLEIGGHMYRVHRIMWEMRHGPIPEGMLVCHHCDNPPCINPDHLFLGTYADNLHDCIRKGRFYTGTHHGMRNGRAKVTDDQVSRMRLEYVAGNGCHRTTQLAKQYGLSWGSVNRIVNRKGWAHIGGLT